MKPYLLKAALLSLFGLLLYTLGLWKVSQGHVDYFYPKFTTRAGSLILGLSRAGDGISPTVIEEHLSVEIEKPMINFAFSAEISEYGEVYHRAVLRKIRGEVRNGLFLLEVSPGSLSVPKVFLESGRRNLDEKSLLNHLWVFNADPNYDYLRRYYGQALYKGWVPRREPYRIRNVHASGWIEVLEESPGYRMSEEDKERWMREALRIHKAKMHRYAKSEYRLEWLGETVSHLKRHGSVILVRMPLHDKHFIQEEEYWPNFSREIKQRSQGWGVDYLDYVERGADYSMYDGSHLLGEGAKAFTRDLCSDLDGLLGK